MQHAHITQIVERQLDLDSHSPFCRYRVDLAHLLFLKRPLLAKNQVLILRLLDNYSFQVRAGFSYRVGLALEHRLIDVDLPIPVEFESEIKRQAIFDLKRRLKVNESLIHVTLGTANESEILLGVELLVLLLLGLLQIGQVDLLAIFTCSLKPK